jgi:hypothetical protein
MLLAHWLNKDIAAECNSLPLAVTRNKPRENAAQWIAYEQEMLRRLLHENLMMMAL